MKTCSQCGIAKQLDAFHKHKSFKDGHTSKCKECRAVNWKKWYAANSDYAKKCSKEYYVSNKDYVLNRNAEYYANKKKTDLNFKLACNLRSRLSKAVSQDTKISAVLNLGCSLEEFRTHIERQFSPGMSWNNYGKWHLDHKVPLSAFDLTNDVELALAAHHTNIQPLWARDNFKKGASIVCQ